MQLNPQKTASGGHLHWQNHMPMQKGLNCLYGSYKNEVIPNDLISFESLSYKGTSR